MVLMFATFVSGYWNAMVSLLYSVATMHAPARPVLLIPDGS